VDVGTKETTDVGPANCLCASLVFAINKFKGRPQTVERDGDLRDRPQREQSGEGHRRQGRHRPRDEPE